MKFGSVVSNKYQRYNDNIKLVNETNNARFLNVKLLLDFEKNINIAPNTGNKISEDKIGKSIILILRKLIMQKNLVASQMHNDK